MRAAKMVSFGECRFEKMIDLEDGSLQDGTGRGQAEQKVVYLT